MLDTDTDFYIIIVMPKRIDPDQRRRAIADAAIQSIAEDGLEGAKLARIARRAGVTTGALTHYFDDKDEVLLAALEEVKRRLMDAIASLDPHPAIDQLAAALPTSDQSAAEWRVWLAFWGRAAFVPALARVHRAYYAEMEEALAARLGGTRENAAAIIAAIDGIGARVSLEPDLWSPARQRDMLIRLIGPMLTEGEQEHAESASPAR